MRAVHLDVFGGTSEAHWIVPEEADGCVAMPTKQTTHVAIAVVVVNAQRAKAAFVPHAIAADRAAILLERD